MTKIMYVSVSLSFSRETTSGSTTNHGKYELLC